MQTFQHGKHTITFNDAGEFTCKLNGQLLKAASLAAMKKKLDVTPKFEPFNCLYKGYRDSEPQSLAVVGVRKRNRGKYRGSEMVWVLADGTEQYHVIEDTIENRLLLKQQNDLQVRHDEQRTAMAAESEEMNAKIVRRRPPTE